MEQFLENVYDVIFQPSVAMRRIAAQKPVGQAVVAFALSVLIPAGAVYLAFETANIGKLLPVIVLVLTLGGLFAWFSGAAVLSMIAEFFGGHGTAKGLFVAMGFAHIPRILAVPFFVLEKLFPGGIFAMAADLAFLVTFFWMLVLDVIAIKEAHGLGGARAVLVLITPLVVLILALLAVLFFAGTTLLSEWVRL